MDSVTIGLWVSGAMLVAVFAGMRVAFAAGLAGFVGLIWVFWDKFKYDPEKFLYYNGPFLGFEERTGLVRRRNWAMPLGPQRLMSHKA